MISDQVAGRLLLMALVVLLPGSLLRRDGMTPRLAAVLTLARGVAPAPAATSGYALLRPDDQRPDDSFGYAIAMSEDGGTVVVGTPQELVYAGKAYVFVRPEGGWGGQPVASATLQGSNRLAGDGFGQSVAVTHEGGTIVVGAPSHDGGRGTLFVFERPAGGWQGTLTEVARLSASDAAVGDGLGGALALTSGPAPTTMTVVAGTTGRTLGGHPVQAGAYLYVRPPSGWLTATESARLLPSDGSAGDHFGASVGIHHNTVLVGAPGATVGGRGRQGAAYLFERPAGGWQGTLVERRKLLASDGQENDSFGRAVAISGSALVVGAPHEMAPQLAPGAAYLFVRPAGGWAGAGALTESARLRASDGGQDDAFGGAVAIKGGLVAVGADSRGVTHLQGAVYLFMRPAGGWSGSLAETARLLPWDSQPEGNFGHALSLDGAAAPRRLAVGARFATAPGEGFPTGSAYVYENLASSLSLR